jgi:hypothetical protein
LLNRLDKRKNEREEKLDQQFDQKKDNIERTYQKNLNKLKDWYKGRKEDIKERWTDDNPKPKTKKSKVPHGIQYEK